MRRKASFHPAIFPDCVLDKNRHRLPNIPLYVEEVYKTGNYDVTDFFGKDIGVVFREGNYYPVPVKY